MLNRLLATQANDKVAALLRLTLGLVMFPHGAQKALGWFGGYGFSGTMNFFTQRMGIPAVFGVLAIAAEFLGALGLITGLLTRIAAFGIALTMAVAILTAHLPNGFFMNWYGTQKGEGFEYHLLALGLAVAVIIRGGGAASIDARLSGKRKA
ncbi:MAG: DoxX family protein [Methylotenera sp.]|nr:DoxX family protein [Oligoflexia bacterium]